MLVFYIGTSGSVACAGRCADLQCESGSEERVLDLYHPPGNCVRRCLVRWPGIAGAASEPSLVYLAVIFKLP